MDDLLKNSENIINNDASGEVSINDIDKLEDEQSEHTTTEMFVEEETDVVVTQNFKKLLFIINPKAGVKRKEDNLIKIINIFNDNGYEVVLRFTRRHKDATKIVATLGNIFDLIVCMGGDGTLNEVIDGMLSAKIKKPLGYIPAGTTNDFANSLNIPKEPIECAKFLMNRKPHYIDLGKFNGRYFVYTASAGIFTKASYSAPQNVKNIFGHFAYILEGTKDLTQVKPLKLKIELKDEVIEDEFIFAAICNSTSIGGLMSIDEKRVDFADGMFEMLLVKFPKDLIELGIIITKITNQKYDEQVKLIKVQRANISDCTNVDWSLDGEKEIGQKKVKFRVVHNGIKFLY